MTANELQKRKPGRPRGWAFDWRRMAEDLDASRDRLLVKVDALERVVEISREIVEEYEDALTPVPLGLVNGVLREALDQLDREESQ